MQALKYLLAPLVLVLYLTLAGCDKKIEDKTSFNQLKTKSNLETLTKDIPPTIISESTGTPIWYASKNDTFYTFTFSGDDACGLVIDPPNDRLHNAISFIDSGCDGSIEYVGVGLEDTSKVRSPTFQDEIDYQKGIKTIIRENAKK